MKIIIPLIIALTALVSTAYSIEVKGDFTSETRFSLIDGTLLFNQENGSLKFEQQVDDNLYGMAKVSFKYYNNPIGSASMNNVLSPTELGTLYSIEPLEIMLDQAYFTYSDFIIPKLDLTAGKQRITWGTADKLNPTDLLNPVDYSDPLDFGKKFATSAVNLTYHIPFFDGGIQAVYEPFAPVARLNTIMSNEIAKEMGSSFQQIAGGINSAFKSSLAADPFVTPVFADNTADWANQTVTTPSVNGTNFNAAGKIFATLAGFDLSLSYINRINDLPTVKSITLNNSTRIASGTNVNPFALTQDIPTNATTTINSKSYDLGYYREQVIGFDFSKDLNLFLLWGEVSVTLPGEQKAVVTVNNSIQYVVDGVTYPVSNATTTTENVALSNEAYVKYTIGLDKNFDGGFYLNFQYNHGFANERGNTGLERLEDYVMLRLEYKTLSDKLKFALTGLLNVNNLYDTFTTNDMAGYFTNNYGVFGQFAVIYMPTQSLSVEVGITGIDGKPGTSLGRIKDYDNIYTKFEYQF